MTRCISGTFLPCSPPPLPPYYSFSPSASNLAMPSPLFCHFLSGNLIHILGSKASLLSVHIRLSLSLFLLSSLLFRRNVAPLSGFCSGAIPLRVQSDRQGVWQSVQQIAEA